MKGVKRLTQSSYDVGDYVVIVPDDHIFDGKDLQNGRGEELLGAITAADQAKLLMVDEGIESFRATVAIPALRSKASGPAGLTPLHRRKYNISNSIVTLKNNAGVN